jgi:hypothetical protein
MARSPRTRNLAYAAVAGLTGCATVSFVIAALLLGVWLDARLGARGPFTIILLAASVPISLLVMVRVAIILVGRIQPSARPRGMTDQKEG